ncbi:hypothetical protein ACFX16_040208 [Malus domestica]
MKRPLRLLQGGLLIKPKRAFQNQAREHLCQVPSRVDERSGHKCHDCAIGLARPSYNPFQPSLMPPHGSQVHSVAYDRSSAPKDCRISGWLRGRDDPEVHIEIRLAEFTYDLEKSNAQTFNVLDSAVSGLVDTVRLDFTSNHGSPSHTCIYRFRVHGHEPNAVSTMAMQQ